MRSDRRGSEGDEVDHGVPGCAIKGRGGRGGVADIRVEVLQAGGQTAAWGSRVEERDLEAACQGQVHACRADDARAAEEKYPHSEFVAGAGRVCQWT